MQKDVKIRRAKRKLKKISRKKVANVPDELLNFSYYIGEVAENSLTPKGLLNFLSLSLYNIERAKESSESNSKIPNQLIKQSRQIHMNLVYFPLIIDEIGSKDFSKQFKILFSQYFGNPI